jgi:uncharacterized SAM-binding protein YcdF (DUF218 family)
VLLELKKYSNQFFGYYSLRRLLTWLMIAFATVYLVLFAIVGLHARKLISQPATEKTDAALILGNRTYLHGAPNPCLTGRVDKGLMLAKQGVVATLAMTGGRDNENYRLEADLMATYAKEKGYTGRILIESRSRSTKENLEFSAPILKAENIKSVIIVSEPYHLWRTERLVNAGHLGQNLKVSYAAALSQCWTSWGMLHKGALREPLAIMHNYAKGYFH